MRKWKIKMLLNNGKKATGYGYIDLESGYEALKEFICEGKEFNEGTLLALRTNNKKNCFELVRSKDISSVEIRPVKIRKSEKRYKQ